MEKSLFKPFLNVKYFRSNAYKRNYDFKSYFKYGICGKTIVTTNLLWSL